MAAERNDREELRRRFAEEARAERPDLALLCLLVAAEADPELDARGIDEAQIELDRLAGMLPYGLRGGHAWASALAELLGERYGFEGSTADYQRLESSLLHEVLRRRRGLPILLSVVWIEVARRAGAPVYGVALPGHFVVGFGDPGERVLADPFAGGRPLTDQDAELMVTSATGERWEPSALEPARPLEVVLRILNNIRAWAAARPEQTAVALWAVELSLLLPAHPARLRYEHAQLLVRAGEFLRGAAEMEEYARVVEDVEPAVAEAVRHSARAARALLN
ncbi:MULTISPECIES: transglutaminase-like domain-containing protein [unclassified Streptomyces]|uniref:transglutaminase-like domain-containing protein n=1 Tax=unclassified Streptomyces TaxID=2593676 RepID=UPI002E2B710E|nr:transglutaminase-like domain-containing protein [Streptomyces sp. NBC_01423]WSX93123.1 transglutaminase-like domain-containing protein [Streptomyces sp. NBC_00891]WSY07600.1 transglutaminase-like domain-containing protein [Streptomyces sp. NBC_00890]WSZ09226.1 transglutaminase-like domain-containing protein [Streptomyces sp. NBC_00869]WSZ23275.1 transglutaminase-like domain-containing protein [Streptomyces sp. NBC_00870]